MIIRGKTRLLAAFLIIALVFGTNSFIYAEEKTQYAEIETNQNANNTDGEEDSLISGNTQNPLGEKVENSKETTSIDQNADEKLNDPELEIEEVVTGEQYDVILTNIAHAAYDYIVIKVWSDQEGEDDVIPYLAEWLEKEEDSNPCYLAHIFVNNHKHLGLFQVVAYGINETESTKIETVDDISVEMLSDEETSDELGITTFVVEVAEEPIEEAIEEPDHFETRKALKASQQSAKPANALCGIDVSKHNGSIDWTKVKNDGIQFAIIRCGYGDNIKSQDDIRWEDNASQCEKRGIPYGVYIYSYATSIEQAKSEADHCVRLLIGHRPSLPVFLDLEDKCMDGLSNAELAAITKAWAVKIQAAGYTPGVYSSKYWWTNRLTSSVFNSYCRWVAQWNTSCTYTGTYAMWQYSSTGSVDGINSNVDMNYWYCGWHKINGFWYYSNSHGMAKGWLKIGGIWYFFNSNRAMVTGWQKIGGIWYYFDSSGAMQTGWQQSGGKWYYLDVNGAMQTGWQKIGGAWYCFDNNGAMLTGWQQSRGNWYYLSGNGKMVVGWLTEGNKKYYLNADGAMLTGWQTIAGVWYWFDSNGAMLTGWQYHKTKWYYLDANGAMQIGWKRIGGVWYCFDVHGAMLTGWIQSNGEWYYLDHDGKMMTGWRNIGGKWYCFNNSGAMLIGWLKSGNAWYYLNSSGAMLTGWQRIGGTWYYFNQNGAMVTGTIIIGGNRYKFSSDGAWIG